MSGLDHVLAVPAVADDQSDRELSRYRLLPVEWLLLASVLLFVAVTRLYGIEDFPIYFFCDEALQANLARDLVEQGLRDEYGVFLPTYFRNVRVFNLGLSVWIHALPVAIFGKSIFVVRSTSVLVGLAGTAALMLALKWFFQIRLWWAAGLVLGALPAWFLHSRTAFETVMMASFYAVFVLAYLLYRYESAWWLPAAIMAGAATFYSYSNGQGVMLVTCVGLLIADCRYHWQVVRSQRGAALLGALTLLVAAAPYLRFRYFLHPEMMELHLQDLRSYWVADIPTVEKLQRFATTYLHGLSPTYWFTENVNELDRHRMLGYPQLPLWLAPAALLGLGVALWRAPRSAVHRLVWIGVLGAPFAASMVGLRITRVLAMVVPATLAITIGLDQLRSWLERLHLPRKLVRRTFAAVVGVGLAAATLMMLRDSLVNGPLWFRDYGLYGMQWGAKELFGELSWRMKLNPEEQFVISHIWANNPNTFAQFFLDPPSADRISWRSLDEILREPRPEVRRDHVFVLTAEEYERARHASKLVVDSHSVVIPDPAGNPAFVICRLTYSQQADAIFRAEADERQRLVEGSVASSFGTLIVRYPVLDSGTIAAAFDGDRTTLARTFDANPARLEIDLPAPQPVRGLRLHLWTANYHVALRVSTADGNTFEVERDAQSGEPPVPIEIELPEPVGDATRLTLMISKSGDRHVHFREIELLR